jgi:hypothetical protein
MKIRFFAACVTACLLIVPLGLPALADHTNPKEPLSETEGAPTSGVPQGLGEWTHIDHFPANPGTDLEFFTKGGATYSSSGTLGQGDEQHVGQRILRLVTRKGKVRPEWVADHGSAHCTPGDPAGTLGLQHDVQVTPKREPRLIVDATDAKERCHDQGGVSGGLEFVNIWGLRKKNFAPREIGMTRHDGYSHNVTVDDERPWIAYNNSSDTGRPWIDVINFRSCLKRNGQTLEELRALCRPEVHRIPFKAHWTAARNTDGELAPKDDGTRGPTACHDITSRGFRIYCAAINGTVVFNTKDMTNNKGNVRGRPLPCTIEEGTDTGAKITDCDLAPKAGNATQDREAYAALGDFNPDTKKPPPPRAKGWRMITQINHPGREPTTNNNDDVRSDEGVAISHEADPVFGGDFMLVSDERGGGVIPGGASCTPGVDNPYGNGGMHVFDISNPNNPKYAKMPDGSKAVFISSNVTAAPTFCNIHVLEKIPGEQRVIMAWYNQGYKIVDYFIDEEGRWTFDEVASFTLPGTNTWTVEDFKIRNHDDGTRTYWFMGSDIQRGIDIVSWRGPTNRNGERADEVATATASAKEKGNLGLVVASLTVLPLAALFGRRRRKLLA